MRLRLQQRQPNVGKKIVAHTSGDSEQLPPKFCLRNLQPNFCITDCTTDEKASFSHMLYKLSRFPWRELRQAPRHGLGYEKLERSSIKASIPQCVTEDVILIAFRFSGKKAMVGYRSGDGVFNILWLDRNFTLYAH